MAVTGLSRWPLRSMMPDLTIALAIGLVIRFILGYGVRAIVSYQRRQRARRRSYLYEGLSKGTDKQRLVRSALASSRPPAASPPAEKTTARQDQTRQSGTRNGTGNAHATATRNSVVETEPCSAEATHRFIECNLDAVSTSRRPRRSQRARQRHTLHRHQSARPGKSALRKGLLRARAHGESHQGHEALHPL